MKTETRESLLKRKKNNKIWGGVWIGIALTYGVAVFMFRPVLPISEDMFSAFVTISVMFFTGAVLFNYKNKLDIKDKLKSRKY